MENENILRMEKAAVEELRGRGLKLREIAKKMNRSIYWVNSRLHGKYEPNCTRVEKHFQDCIVVKTLEGIGCNIITGETRTRCEEFNQEVDVMAARDGVIYVIEVKNLVNHHQLQTAIGQIILHQYGRRDEDNIVYQIVFPMKYKDEPFFSDELLDYFSSKMNINIIFM